MKSLRVPKTQSASERKESGKDMELKKQRTLLIIQNNFLHAHIRKSEGLAINISFIFVVGMY